MAFTPGTFITGAFIPGNCSSDLAIISKILREYLFLMQNKGLLVSFFRKEYKNFHLHALQEMVASDCHYIKQF